MNEVFKINIPIRVRYFAKQYESGLTDLKCIITNPNGIDSSPIFLTEIEKGVYETTFTPNLVGYWLMRITSLLSPKNTYGTRYFVNTSYSPFEQPNLTLIDFQYFSSDFETSTTATSFINKITGIFTPSAIGDYLVFWQADIANSLAGADNLFRVQLNGLDITNTRQNAGITYSNNGWLNISGMKKITLPVSQQTFTIDFARVTGTAYIKNTRIMCYRIA